MMTVQPVSSRQVDETTISSHTRCKKLIDSLGCACSKRHIVEGIAALVPSKEATDGPLYSRGTKEPHSCTENPNTAVLTARGIRGKL